MSNQIIIPKNRLIQAINHFPKTKIVILGDLIVDKYIYGKVSRISPEAPVPVVEVNEERTMPGGAGNVAANIAALEGKVFICGTVGQDELGEELLAGLSNQGINTEGVFSDDSRPTTLKTRIVANHQQVVRCDWEDRTHLSLSLNKKIIAYLRNIIKQIDCIIVSDYGKGVINPFLLSGLIHLAQANSKPVIVDPKIEHFLRYRKVTVVTPNLAEAMSGMHHHRIDSEKDIEELGKKILIKLNCKAVLITLGEKGMILFQYASDKHRLQITKIPTAAKEVYDVTGAGDTVVSVISLGIASRLDIRASAYLANFAAGIVVGKLGTATVSRGELREILNSKKIETK